MSSNKKNVAQMAARQIKKPVRKVANDEKARYIAGEATVITTMGFTAYKLPENEEERATAQEDAKLFGGGLNATGAFNFSVPAKGVNLSGSTEATSSSLVATPILEPAGSLIFSAAFLESNQVSRAVPASVTAGDSSLSGEKKSTPPQFDGTKAANDDDPRADTTGEEAARRKKPFRGPAPEAVPVCAAGNAKAEASVAPVSAPVSARQEALTRELERRNKSFQVVTVPISVAVSSETIAAALQDARNIPSAFDKTKPSRQPRINLILPSTQKPSQVPNPRREEASSGSSLPQSQTKLPALVSSSALKPRPEEASSGSSLPQGQKMIPVPASLSALMSNITAGLHFQASVADDSTMTDVPPSSLSPRQFGGFGQEDSHMTVDEEPIRDPWSPSPYSPRQFGGFEEEDLHMTVDEEPIRDPWSPNSYPAANNYPLFFPSLSTIDQNEDSLMSDDFPESSLAYLEPISTDDAVMSDLPPPASFGLATQMMVGDVNMGGVSVGDNFDDDWYMEDVSGQSTWIEESDNCRDHEMAEAPSPQRTSTVISSLSLPSNGAFISGEAFARAPAPVSAVAGFLSPSRPASHTPASLSVSQTPTANPEIFAYATERAPVSASASGSARVTSSPLAQPTDAPATASVFGLVQPQAARADVLQHASSMSSSMPRQDVGALVSASTFRTFGPMANENIRVEEAVAGDVEAHAVRMSGPSQVQWPQVVDSVQPQAVTQASPQPICFAPTDASEDLTTFLPSTPTNNIVSSTNSQIFSRTQSAQPAVLSSSFVFAATPVTMSSVRPMAEANSVAPSSLLQQYFGRMGDAENPSVTAKCPTSFTDAQKAQFSAAYKIRALNKGLKAYMDALPLGGDPTPAMLHYSAVKGKVADALESSLARVKRKLDLSEDGSSPSKKARVAEVPSLCPPTSTDPPILKSSLWPKPASSSLSGGKRKAEVQLTKDDVGGAQERKSAFEVATESPGRTIKSRKTASTEVAIESPGRTIKSIRSRSPRRTPGDAFGGAVEPVVADPAVPRVAPTSSSLFSSLPRSNLFAPVNRSGTSSPGAASSRGSSIFDGPVMPRPDPASINIFGHLSDRDSGADSGQGNDADDDTDEDGGEEDDKKEVRAFASPAIRVEEPREANFTPPTIRLDFGSDTVSGSTTTTGRSLFDRISRDADGNPIREIPPGQDQSPPSNSPSSIFAAHIDMFQTPGEVDTEMGGLDDTEEESQPQNISAPTAGFGVFDNHPPPQLFQAPAHIPSASIFGNRPPAGFGTFSFTSSLFPPAAGSDTSRATTPSGTTDGETNDENGDPDAEHHAQIDLTASGAGEENETVVHMVRAKALKFETSKVTGKSDWAVKGLGPLRILKHNQTGASRILMRADPRGIIVLNKGILGNVPYQAAGKTLKLLTAGEGGQGLETWIIQVKTPEAAQELAQHLEQHKRRA